MKPTVSGTTYAAFHGERCLRVATGQVNGDGTVVIDVWSDDGHINFRLESDKYNDEIRPLRDLLNALNLTTEYKPDP